MTLELRLACIQEAASRIVLRLLVTNHERYRVLIPQPGIIGLQFTDASGAIAEWYTSSLVHANWAGLLLNPVESHVSTFSVRPSSVERPRHNDNSDYYRWCVGIAEGRYNARYAMFVGPD